MYQLLWASLEALTTGWRGRWRTRWARCSTAKAASIHSTRRYGMTRSASRASTLCGSYNEQLRVQANEWAISERSTKRALEVDPRTSGERNGCSKLVRRSRQQSWSYLEPTTASFDDEEGASARGRRSWQSAMLFVDSPEHKFTKGIFDRICPNLARPASGRFAPFGMSKFVFKRFFEWF